MAKLTDKVALVTGAGRGIGRAICEEFAAEGAAVVCADIDLVNAQTVATGIKQSGGQASVCQCDVSDSNSVQKMIKQAIDDFGKLQIIVCGAAVITPQSTLADLNEAEWHKAISVNLTGAFLTCKYALPKLQAAGSGSVILIASQMARVASEGSATYCATKGALVQLAKGMALDHVQDNIRVNTLSPGGTATERLFKRFGDKESAQRIWGPKHPMGRLGEPEEIARGAVFLASDDSSFMTGADLLLDGGYSAW